MSEFDVIGNVILDIVKNPIMLALIFAIIRNIGGYIVACFEAKKLLPYENAKFLKTLTLYEVFLVSLIGVASLPQQWAVTLTVIVDIIYSLKTAIENPTPE